MNEYQFTFGDIYELIKNNEQIPVGKAVRTGYKDLGLFVYSGAKQINVVKVDESDFPLSICNIVFHPDETREDGSFTVIVYECPVPGYCDYSKVYMADSTDRISDVGIWNNIPHGATVEGVLLITLAMHRLSDVYSEK